MNRAMSLSGRTYWLVFTHWYGTVGDVCRWTRPPMKWGDLRVLLVGCAMFVVGACGGELGERDPGAHDIDVEVPIDADEVDADDVDASELDASELDAGELDAGSLDASELDASELDAGALDAGATDPCAAAPCANGGICVTSGGSFSCTCAAGVEGPTCEIDQRVCLGTAAYCYQQPNCVAVPGCSLGHCFGYPLPCQAFTQFGACFEQNGCTWIEGPPDIPPYDGPAVCSGTVPEACAPLGPSCVLYAGCTYLSRACEGVIPPCAELTPSVCVQVAGCYLGVEP
jgi:hypothetical protein